MKKGFVVYDLKCDKCNYKFSADSTTSKKTKWETLSRFTDARWFYFNCPNCNGDVLWKVETRPFKKKDTFVPEEPRVEHKGGIIDREIEVLFWGLVVFVIFMLVI